MHVQEVSGGEASSDTRTSVCVSVARVSTFAFVLECKVPGEKLTSRREWAICAGVVRTCCRLMSNRETERSFSLRRLSYGLMLVRVITKSKVFSFF